MSDANVVKLLQPGSFADPLTEVLRNGARALRAQAVEAEVGEFLAKYIDLKTAFFWLGPRGPPRAPARTRGDDRHRSGRRAPASRA